VTPSFLRNLRTLMLSASSFMMSSCQGIFSHMDIVSAIARLDWAIQYARLVFTGSPGRAGR
jgi:hypothetical protein